MLAEIVRRTLQSCHSGFLPMRPASTNLNPWEAARQSVIRGATGSGHSTQMDTPFW